MTPRPRPALVAVVHAVVVLTAISALAGCESRPSAVAPAPAQLEASARRPAPTPRPRPPARGTEAAPDDAPLAYVERITGGAAASAELPLVVAVHGLGDAPESFAGILRGFDAPARVLLPAGPTPHGRGFSWFPYRPGRSEEELARGIADAADRVATFIAWAVTTRPTQGRPVVTGFSQGGMVSFALAATHPDEVVAALPVGGTLPRPLWPASAPSRAPWIAAFHGDADPIVPVEPTRAVVRHLDGLGYDVTLRTFPGVGHSVPPPMRAAWHAALRKAVSPPP